MRPRLDVLGYQSAVVCQAIVAAPDEWLVVGQDHRAGHAPDGLLVRAADPDMVRYQNLAVHALAFRIIRNTIMAARSGFLSTNA